MELKKMYIITKNLIHVHIGCQTILLTRLTMLPVIFGDFSNMETKIDLTSLERLESFAALRYRRSEEHEIEK